MKKIFELPELLTLSGEFFSSGNPEEGDDDPNSCVSGCDPGCHGGCDPGSGANE